MSSPLMALSWHGVRVERELADVSSYKNNNSVASKPYAKISLNLNYLFKER